MSEILFKLTNERLKILENDVLLHPDEDFCAYCPENIFPEENISVFNSAFYGTAVMQRRGDFLNISLCKDYLRECVREYRNNDPKNSDGNFWREYARIRIESVPGRHAYDYTENQLARTAALSAVPRRIEKNGFCLRLGDAKDAETTAKIFFKYDSARESDSMLDTELLNFILEVCK